MFCFWKHKMNVALRHKQVGNEPWFWVQTLELCDFLFIACFFCFLIRHAFHFASYFVNNSWVHIHTYIWILSTSSSSDKICRAFYVFSLLMKNNVALPQWHPPLKSLNLGYLNCWQCTNISSLEGILITFKIFVLKTIPNVPRIIF